MGNSQMNGGAVCVNFLGPNGRRFGTTLSRTPPMPVLSDAPNERNTMIEADTTAIRALRLPLATGIPALCDEVDRLRELVRASTVTTAEELDALPFLSIVREVFRQSPSGADYGGVWERRTSGWHCIAGSVNPPERDTPKFPCRVIHHPAPSRPLTRPEVTP